MIFRIHNRATNQRYEFRAESEAVAALKIAGEYTYGTAAERTVEAIDDSAEIAAAQRKAVIATVQARMDEYARSWGYDSIASAASYRNDPHADFAAEAAMLFAWRSATWVYLTDAAATQTSVDALLSGLPPFPARPGNGG